MGCHMQAQSVRRQQGSGPTCATRVPIRPQPSVRQILTRTAIQPKLRIGAVNDPAEAEADHVANQVMRMPDSRDSGAAEHAPPGPPTSALIGQEPVRRMCDECEGELHRKPADGDGPTGDEMEEMPVRAKEASASGAKASPAAESAIGSLAGGGTPLAASERAFFEPRFGRSFANVRIHDGQKADTAAKSINARAFALGNSVAFAGGEYRPGSTEGRRLMAHELTHVVQNSGRDSDGETHLRRMARGAAGGSPRGNYVPVPADETARVDAATAIIERIKNDRANYPGCHRFFTDNCPGGTATSFIDAVDAAVVWKRHPNPEGWLGSTHGNTHHVAYTRVPYDVSKWSIAATLVHELIHTCGQNDHDIGDDAKHACGRLPNI